MKSPIPKERLRVSNWIVRDFIIMQSKYLPVCPCALSIRRSRSRCEPRDCSAEFSRSSIALRATLRLLKAFYQFRLPHFVRRRETAGTQRVNSGGAWFCWHRARWLKTALLYANPREERANRGDLSSEPPKLLALG